MYFLSKSREFTKPVYSETEGRYFKSTREMEEHAKAHGLCIGVTPLHSRVKKKYAKYIDGVPQVWSFEKNDWVPVGKEETDEK